MFVECLDQEGGDGSLLGQLAADLIVPFLGKEGTAVLCDVTFAVAVVAPA